jgi:hypothetical protein
VKQMMQLLGRLGVPRAVRQPVPERLDLLDFITESGGVIGVQPAKPALGRAGSARLASFPDLPDRL